MRLRPRGGPRAALGLRPARGLAGQLPREAAALHPHKAVHPHKPHADGSAQRLAALETSARAPSPATGFQSQRAGGRPWGQPRARRQRELALCSLLWAAQPPPSPPPRLQL
jgi:hypothetical protein